jgi:mono/diheme cytochrome c family protein
MRKRNLFLCSCTALAALLGSCALDYRPQPVTFTAAVTPAQVAEGKRLTQLLCSACHYDPATRQLTGIRIKGVPDFVGKVYSRNLTQHPEQGIAGYTDGELVYLLRTGVSREGTLMPYMQKPLLADEDVQAIITFLRSADALVAPSAVEPPPTRYTLLGWLGLRVFSPPLPAPRARIVKPDPANERAHGKYLVANLGCFECHSASFSGIDRMEPETSTGYMGGGTMLRDVQGNPLYSPNLTFHESGLAGWSERDFIKALTTGVSRDDAPLRYPMPSYAELTEQEAAAMYTYVASLPPINKKVTRTKPAHTAHRASGGLNPQLTLGKKYYEQYACGACHGEKGVAMGDLRQAHRYTDEQLQAYIRNPRAFGNFRMPVFAEVIAPEDYPALIAYVKWPGKANQ